jgi:hypothetical protein
VKESGSAGTSDTSKAKIAKKKKKRFVAWPKDANRFNAN